MRVSQRFRAVARERDGDLRRAVARLRPDDDRLRAEEEPRALVRFRALVLFRRVDLRAVAFRGDPPSWTAFARF
jgi:hypothetical protein